MDLFAGEREKMVGEQIAARGITDPRVLDAMRRVPRHLFVPEESRATAYGDHPVQIGQGQTISQPYMVGLMTQLMELHPSDSVLEIGTGSGYQAAILAELAATVISIERNQSLADAARERLAGMGYGNLCVVAADGTLGWPVSAPYDAIIVTAAGPDVPHTLKEQLKEGGRLVCPRGSREVQTLVRIKKTGLSYEEEDFTRCVFVPLIGKLGWPT